MINGEDIIATLLDEDEQCYFITCPFVFTYSQDPITNNMNTGMMPWVPTNDLMGSIFRIYKFDIMTESPAPQKMKNAYESSVKLSEIDTVKNIQDLYESIQNNPKLNDLLMANTINNLIH